MKSESGCGGTKEARNVFIITTQTVCCEQIYKLINVYVQTMCCARVNDVVMCHEFHRSQLKPFRWLPRKIQSRNCNAVEFVWKNRQKNTRRMLTLVDACSVSVLHHSPKKKYRVPFRVSFRAENARVLREVTTIDPSRCFSNHLRGMLFKEFVC